MTQFRNFGTPLITVEPIEISASNLAQTYITDPYCVRIMKWPQNGRGLGHVTKFRNFGPPDNFWTNSAICFKFGTNIEDGSLLRLDHKTTPKWTCPGSRDQISKFWDPPYNFWSNRDIRFKFGTDIHHRPLLRPGHESTPKWAWPRSRDQIFNFWDPLINFERIDISASNLTQTDDGPLLRPDHKTTPKWAWRESRDIISKFWDPLISFKQIEQWALNLVQT